MLSLSSSSVVEGGGAAARSLQGSFLTFSQETSGSFGEEGLWCWLQSLENVISNYPWNPSLPPPSRALSHVWTPRVCQPNSCPWRLGANQLRHCKVSLSILMRSRRSESVKAEFTRSHFRVQANTSSFVSSLIQDQVSLWRRFRFRSRLCSTRTRLEFGAFFLIRPHYINRSFIYVLSRLLNPSAAATFAHAHDLCASFLESAPCLVKVLSEGFAPSSRCDLQGHPSRICLQIIGVFSWSLDDFKQDWGVFEHICSLTDLRRSIGLFTSHSWIKEFDPWIC